MLPLQTQGEAPQQEEGADSFAGLLNLPARQPLSGMRPLYCNLHSGVEIDFYRPEVYARERSASWRQQQGRVGHDELEVELLLCHLPVLVLEHVEEDLLALVEVPEDEHALLPRLLHSSEVLVQK